MSRFIFAIASPLDAPASRRVTRTTAHGAITTD
ncbi:hypothetical protein HNQ52_002683 [Chiayiivirga flava]|uniref:Uncharacterized protein n=1 Tax=Chiayiivirga flava TaxID=659595 RepID=A0A7W8G2W9_9GAMM|nr:hypothetical protein [Chiayiivirga flava]